MDKYFETKKRQGLIFTLHNINPKLPYRATDKIGRPIEPPGGGAWWWSRLSGRYREAEEQRDFIRSGFVDKKLPPIEVTL